VSQPWFERRNPRLGSFTYTPSPWGTDDTVSQLRAPVEELKLLEIVLKQEWGFGFMIAAASGALIAFITAASRPTEQNGRRGSLAGVVISAIAVALIGVMWFAFAAGADLPDSTTHVRIGLLAGVPASLAWLALSIVVWRLGARARVPAPVGANR
jgi:hypothetical protein